MFCIVAFIVLALLGIFSARYRELAREALGCVSRRVTLRPCTTGFDEKIKSKILGTVITRSETAARVINKNFELLSWTFFLLMVASTLYAVRGLYLFYMTGSCSGLNEASFCLLDPGGEHGKVSGLSGSCREKPTTVADLTLKGVDLSLFPTVNKDSRQRIVLIGCYGCEYTRKVYGSLTRLAERDKAAFIFVDYPVKVSTTLATRLGQCVYQRDQAKYWRLNGLLMQAPIEHLDDASYLSKVAGQIGINQMEIERCINDRASGDLVVGQMQEALKTNFFGTPTVFIDSQAFVGPKPYRVYAIALKGPFYWAR